MADPASIAALSMAGSSAGGAMGFFGALSKGQSESSMYNYKAGVSDLNQKIALMNRDWAYQTGEKEAMRSGMKTRAQLGEITAGQSGSGFDVNAGSAPLVRGSQKMIGQMDMDTIRTNAARAAFGYSIEGEKAKAESGMYQRAALDARKASYINAAGSLVSGATSVSSKWLQAKDAGIFGKSVSDTYSHEDAHWGI